MCPFLYATGIAVEDERTLERGVQDPIHRTVHQSVAHARFVDHPMLGVKDVEPVVGAVTIPTRHEVVVQLKHVVLQMSLKLLHVLPPPLATVELVPGMKKILERRNLFKHMTSETFQKTYDFYKHLYVNLRAISKRDRFTWGNQTDQLALHALSLSAKASYLPKPEKNEVLRNMSTDVDLLKIFLRLGFDLRILDEKKYIARQGELQEIGKMLGGWMKQT